MNQRTKAGDLRFLVELQKPVMYVNDRGRRIPVWESVRTVYAAKRDVSGREFFQAQAYHAEDVITFRIRWRDDVSATWRVKHHGVCYEIIEVNHLGYMRDYMDLKCRAVTGEGAV